MSSFYLGASYSMTSTSPEMRTSCIRDSAILGGLVLVAIGAFAPVLAEVGRYWSTPQYSHGGLVAALAVGLLWLRRHGNRDDLAPRNAVEWAIVPATGILWGVAALGQGAWIDSPLLGLSLRGWFFALGGVVLGSAAVVQKIAAVSVDAEPSDESNQPEWIRARPLGFMLVVSSLAYWLGCARLGLDVPEMYAFGPCFLGLALLVLGKPGFELAWPSAVFFVLMAPLPYTLEQRLLVPLQGLAADGATYLLQLAGYEAANEAGHFIRLGALKLGVVEQCSGLRMATVFLALCAAAVVVVRLPKWQIPVFLLAAVPIALAVNILRITVTAILMVEFDRQLAEKVFHDWAGYAMPVVAVGLLALLAVLLDRLVVWEEDDSPVDI
ncbi:MAG: exosortase/archaeosortase family protein [Planctomycetota bacterium]|nr:MAG: exosortase/archaeosortase family protein [Planctomycetota bacterium]